MAKLYDYGPTVTALSRLISQLYAYNANDARARLLHLAWTRFVRSRFYAVHVAVGVVGAFPYLEAFAMAAFVLRRLVPNQPPVSDVYVFFPNLVAESVTRNWEDASALVNLAIEHAKKWALETAREAVMPLGLLLVGLYALHRATTK